MANYQALAAKIARKYGIPVSLFRTLVRFESGYQAHVVSPAGAIGLTQLMPATAKGLGVDPYNPAQNLDGGARYLKQQYDHFGSWDKALAAYNAGPGAVQKYNGIPPYAETQKYVHGILGAAGPLTAGARTTRRTVTVAQPSAPAAPPAAPQPPDLSSVALDNLSHLASGTFTPAGALGALTSAVAAQPPTPAAPTPAPVAPSPAGPAPAGTAPRFPKAKSTRAKHVIDLAKSYLGTPYVWGGESPKGFDCSGLLQYVWGKAGVSIPRVTYDQWHAGTAVKRGQLQPGDAVFFRMGKNGPEHIGMYLGGGRFIQAPHTGDVVKISKLAGYPGYVGARRFG